MTTVAQILNFIETIAPPTMAMDWDNVGLLCGSKTRSVSKILLALDPFEEVCREAADIGADLIVTHHPLIFHGQKAITDETEVGRCIRFLCQHNICAINAHTNLDCAPGGVNDVLASVLGLKEIQVIDPTGTDEQGRPWGLLRQGTVVDEQPLEAFLPKVKEALHCDGLRYVDGGSLVRRVAVGGGGCSGYLADARKAGCDTFVTADVQYNGFWDAKSFGMNLIDAGHFHTENPAIFMLAEKLQANFPEIEVKISEEHGDCMKFY